MSETNVCIVDISRAPILSGLLARAGNIADQGSSGIEIPETITLEICGKAIVLDPQAKDFDRHLKDVAERLNAWGVLCRAFAREGRYDQGGP